MKCKWNKCFIINKNKKEDQANSLLIKVEMKGLLFGDWGRSQLAASVCYGYPQKRQKNPKIDVGGHRSSFCKWFMLKCYLNLLC